MRHYELTNETLECDNVVLHRIRATRDFVNQGKTIQAGTLGGWIEGYHNLKDDAWVADEAQVYGKATVSSEALVANHATVFGHALVTHEATVTGNACVRDNAKVFGKAWVGGYAICFDNSRVYGEANVWGSATLSDEASIFGEVEVSNGYFGSNAEVASAKHFVFMDTYTAFPLKLTLFRTANGGHLVNMDAWSGTIDELEEQFESDEWFDVFNQAYIEEAREEMLAVCVMLRARIKRWDSTHAG